MDISLLSAQYRENLFPEHVDREGDGDGRISRRFSNGQNPAHQAL
jgi:hypothetical protein